MECRVDDQALRVALRWIAQRAEAGELAVTHAAAREALIEIQSEANRGLERSEGRT